MSYRSFYMPVSISTIAKHKGSNKVDTMLIRMYEMAVWVYEIVRIIMFFPYKYSSAIQRGIDFCK
jgi:hypothetical protein